MNLFLDSNNSLVGKLLVLEHYLPVILALDFNIMGREHNYVR